MNRRSPERLCSLLVFVFLAPIWAGEVTQYLPEDALGFALVHNLSETDAKIDKLVRMFEIPLPAPLTFVKAATGLQAGLDLQGDVLIALLPGEQNSTEILPMVLLPVSDYEAFATSVSGDPSGEICRVSIAGEDVLIAKNRDFTLLMNVEHRETLQVLLSLQPRPVPDLKPIDGWLADNDMTIVLMPTGLKTVLKLGQDALVQHRAGIDQQLEDPQFAELAQKMRKSTALTQWLLDLVSTHLHLAAVGVKIDSQSNLHFGERLVLRKESSLSENGISAVTRTPPLTGFANQPFVLVGGGPLPQSWVDTMASFTRKLMQQMPELYGLENLPADQWDKLEETYRTMMVGMENFSWIMLPGTEADPLFGNIYGIARVEDAHKYVKDYMKASQDWNEIMAESTSDISLDYEVHSKEVDGAKGCEIVVDVAAAARDPNVPILNWLLEAMFGEDGKMHQLLLAVNEKTLVYGMADERSILPFLKQVRQKEMGLSNDLQVQASLALLPEEASWKLLISLPGCVQWADRLVKEFLVHLQQQKISIPEFDTCLPIGVSLGLGQRSFACDMVWPADTLQALAAYIKKCQAL